MNYKEIIDDTESSANELVGVIEQCNDNALKNIAAEKLLTKNATIDQMVKILLHCSNLELKSSTWDKILATGPAPYQLYDLLQTPGIGQIHEPAWDALIESNCINDHLAYVIEFAPDDSIKNRAAMKLLTKAPRLYHIDKLLNFCKNASIIAEAKILKKTIVSANSPHDPVK